MVAACSCCLRADLRCSTQLQDGSNQPISQLQLALPLRHIHCLHVVAYA